MNFKIKLPLFLILLLFAGSANAASTVQLGARCPSKTKTGSKLEFLITYQNAALPTGTRVFVETAFSEYYDAGEGGNGKTIEWANPKLDEALSARQNVWTLQFNNDREINSDGTIHGNTTPMPEFVFKLVLPDGSVSYDNGGSEFGHYKAWLTSVTGGCENYPKFDPVKVLVIR